MYVYRIINKQNGKIYIGQTIRPVKQRLQRHINDAMHNVLDTHFARAIRKYGAENFEIEIIDTAINQKELTQKEQEWICKTDSTNPCIGYNETDAIEKSGGNTYCHKTEQEMINIRNKLRLSKIGTHNPNAKAIKCLNIHTGQELHFPTLHDAQIHFHEKTHRFITTRVTGITRGLYQNTWAIAYETDNYHYETSVRKKGKRVLCKDTTTNTTTEFPSIRYASRVLNLNRNLIQKTNENVFTVDKYQFTLLD